MIFTKEQDELLRNNAHLLPVAELGDGDILVLDKGIPADLSIEEKAVYGPYVPYVLTTDGFVQDVTRHYRYRHNLKPADWRESTS